MNKTAKPLSDHKQNGKKFTPPMLQVGEFREISWVQEVLPELLWLVLINKQLGFQRASLVLSDLINQILQELAPRREWLATVSSWSLLDSSNKANVRKFLIRNNALPEIQEALIDLISFFPNCPLGFLFEDCPRVVMAPDITRLKFVINSCFDKTSSNATFAMAQAVHIAIVADLLRVVEVGNIDQIVDYPHTENSRRVASALRSTVNAFFINPLQDYVKDWSKNFWNRGLELEKCTFPEESENE